VPPLGGVVSDSLTGALTNTVSGVTATVEAIDTHLSLDPAADLLAGADHIVTVTTSEQNPQDGGIGHLVQTPLHLIGGLL